MFEPAMNTQFFYGLILALISVVYTLVAFFLGFQTDKLALGRWFGLLPMILMIVVLWLGMKAVREEAKDKSLSYGKGVKTGFLITLYGNLIGTIYGFIHFKFINPSFVDYVVDAARQQWVQRGFSDTQMEMAEKGTRLFMSPAVLSIFGLLFSLFFGLAVALILAAILKRKPMAVTTADSPPIVAS